MPRCHPRSFFFFLMQRKASSHCLLARKQLCLVLCLEVNSKCNKNLDVKLKCKAIKKEIVHGMKNFHRRDFLRHFFKKTVAGAREMSQQLKELAVQARGPEFRYPPPMQWTRRGTVHTCNPALRGHRIAGACQLPA